MIASSVPAATSSRLWGKFQGTVVNNIDPRRMGRIQVMVPQISPIPLLHWAKPCLPVGGMQMGIFSVPLVNAGVWVEFQDGDIDYPIWTGCFWGSEGEIPSRANEVPPLVPAITLQTPGQNGIVISDFPGPTGGIQLRTTSGAMISVTDLGITISNGQGASISLVGNVVSINGTALQIM